MAKTKKFDDFSVTVSTGAPLPPHERTICSALTNISFCDEHEDGSVYWNLFITTNTGERIKVKPSTGWIKGIELEVGDNVGQVANWLEFAAEQLHTDIANNEFNPINTDVCGDRLYGVQLDIATESVLAHSRLHGLVKALPGTVYSRETDNDELVYVFYVYADDKTGAAAYTERFLKKFNIGGEVIIKEVDEDGFVYFDDED